MIKLNVKNLTKQFALGFLATLAEGLLASPPQEWNIGYILVIATIRGISGCLS